MTRRAKTAAVAAIGTSITLGLAGAASAQAVRLATGNDTTADGYLDIAPDEYGAWTQPFAGGEGPNDDHFNPAGADALAQVAFSSGFFIFSGTQRELLSDSVDWQASFPADASLDRQILVANSASDTTSNGVDDTATSSFRVFGGTVDLEFDLVQSVSEHVAGSIALMTQVCTISNVSATDAAFTLVRAFDGDLLWSGGFENDAVGTATNAAFGTLPRFVNQQEASSSSASITLSCNSGTHYYGGKHGLEPAGGPPAYDFGTDTEVWDAFGVPASWQNHIAGVGYDTDGSSGTAPPGSTAPEDGFVGLAIPVDLAAGTSVTITVVHTYGATTPFGDAVPDLLTRAQASAALLDDVPIDLDQAGVWSPFENYGYGAGREGLVPTDTVVDPGNAPLSDTAKPGLVTSTPSYTFWINDGGPGGFGHPTRFALVDATHPDPIVGDGIVVEPYEWWPIVTLPGGEPIPYFESLSERVTPSAASPGNEEGLVGGPAASPDDVGDTPPSKSEPEEDALWGIIVRGADDDRYEHDLNRFRNDLKDHYGVPDGNIVVKGDRGDPAASKQDMKDAITDLCDEIEKSGKPCEKIYVRIMAHGLVDEIYFSDGHYTDTEFCAVLQDLAKKGVPICFLTETCHSGSLLDVHNWDFPAGSSIITSADSAGSSWSDTWEDADGNPVTGSLYPLAFSQCLNSDPNASPSADANDDDFIDECEAHDWVIAQNPEWEWPGNGMNYNGTRANPQKVVVGLTPSGLNVNVCNSTGEPKTDFHIIFKGNVPDGFQHAWRSTANDVIGDRWAETGETITYDEEADTTMVCWEDQSDPVQPGDYIHFGYLTSAGLKPVRQYWTPTGEPDGSATDRAPTTESSMHSTADETGIVIRTVARSADYGGTDSPILVEYFYRVAPASLPLEDLNLGFLDAQGILPHPLGFFPMNPDQPQEFLLQIPDDVGPDEVLILESHTQWEINPIVSMQLLQFEPLLAPAPPCDGDSDGNGVVNVVDLVNVILDWGTDGSANGGDVNGSGFVDVEDLVLVVLSWGPCE